MSVVSWEGEKVEVLDFIGTSRTHIPPGDQPLSVRSDTDGESKVRNCPKRPCSSSHTRLSSGLSISISLTTKRAKLLAAVRLPTRLLADFTIAERNDIANNRVEFPHHLPQSPIDAPVTVHSSTLLSLATLVTSSLQHHGH